MRFIWGCHGITERCFVINGKPMKICARCFGSTIGHVVSIIVLVLGKLPPWYISCILIVPVAIDGLIQNYLKIMSNNIRRFLTGLLGGFGIGAILWGSLFFIGCYVLKCLREI